MLHPSDFDLYGEPTTDEKGFSREFRPGLVEKEVSDEEAEKLRKNIGSDDISEAVRDVAKEVKPRE